MPKRQLTKAQPSRKLLKTLTDNPALPAFVRTLKAPVLKRLIDHVGLHDAGDLIALTSTEQMRDIFEESLWETLIPGERERLRPERFLEWLDVMFEAGPAFAAERLIELGDTFVALHFAPLITVIDSGVMSEHQEGDGCMCTACILAARDASFEVIGDYIVVGLHDDEWDPVRTALIEIDGEDAVFLQRVLAQCSTAPSMRSFSGQEGQRLLDDETYAREQRRERSGFVTPQMAAVFLKTTRKATRDDLIEQVDYDAVSQRYFEQLAAAAVAAADAAVERARKPAEADDEDAAAGLITPLQLRALEGALADAQIIGDRQPALLAGPVDAREPALELQVRLDHLQMTNPDAFAMRLGELIFLANVLMSGSWYQGDRFTEAEAAKAALACANLGLDQLLAEEFQTRNPTSALDRADRVADILGNRPGIVRLFQIGWHRIQALPMYSARTLLDALRADHVRAQLIRKLWILDEIESAVSDPDILHLIDVGEFADVADNLALLSLVLDARACRCLRTLITDFPRYPMQLNLGFRTGAAATNESRYLTTLAQLEKVDVFLDELDALLKI
jgi:hypothetical protein